MSASLSAACLAVCDDTIIEDLQEDVEHVAVRLLDLIEEDDAVRPPADRLRQLPALVITHVSCKWLMTGSCDMFSIKIVHAGYLARRH